MEPNTTRGRVIQLRPHVRHRRRPIRLIMDAGRALMDLMATTVMVVVNIMAGLALILMAALSTVVILTAIAMATRKLTE
jgi:hypothetical protein